MLLGLLTTLHLPPALATDLLPLLLQEKKFDRGFWIDLWRSDDLGQSFAKIATPVPISRSGNPPTLTLLADGRLALVYGWRLPPYGVRARFSSDDGCASLAL